MSNNLRAQIFSFDDRRRIPLVIPEWEDVTVYCCSMSVEQRLAYVEALKKHPDESRNLLLTVFATEDEFGNPLFLPDDIAPLRKKNAGVIARIAETIDSMIPTREEILKNLPAPR